MASSKSASKLDDKTKKQIINKWKTSKLNSIPDIARKMNLPYRTVNTIINKYLSTKINS